MRLRRMLALSATAGALAACGDFQVIPTDGQPIREEIPVTMEGLTLTSYVEAGAPSQIIRAREAQLFEDEQMATLTDFSIDFYENNEVASLLNADRGQVNLRDSTFVAFARDERIRIVHLSDNIVLYVTQCSYDPETGELSTHLPAGVEPPGGTDEDYVLIKSLDDGTARVIRGTGIVLDREFNGTLTSPSLRLDPTFDLERFDQEFRPLHREVTL